MTQWVESLHSPWGFKDDYKDFSSNPDCHIASLRELCDCTWHRFESLVTDETRIQHGENPEHSIVVGNDQLRLGEQCPNRHLIELCAWAGKVIERAHNQTVVV